MMFHPFASTPVVYGPHDEEAYCAAFGCERLVVTVKE
jgi:hypothetical protein